MQSSQPVKSFLAIVFVLLVSGLVGQIIWATLQADEVRRISSLAVDPAGHVVVGLTDELITLDQTGKIVSRTLLPKAEGDAYSVIVADVDFDQRGHFVIANQGNSAIKKYDSNHRLLWKNGGEGSGPGEFWGTIKLAVHPQTGDVYATDASGHRMHIFDADGYYRKTVGSKGRAPGKFLFPNGVQFDSDGNLLVVNTNAYRIDRFDADGNHLSSIDIEPPLEAHPYPIFMTLDDEQNMYVIMGANNLEVGRLYKYDRDGKPLFKFLHADFPADLAGPVKLGDQILVANRNQWKLLAFQPDGLALGTFKSIALTEVFNAIHQQKLFYHRLKLGGQIGLVALILLLLPLYTLQQKKTQQATTAAAPTEEHRLPPLQLPETIKPGTAVLGTFGTILALVAIFWAASITKHPLAGLAAQIMAVTLIWLWFAIVGFKTLSQQVFKHDAAALKRLLAKLPIALPETETIQAALISRRGAKPRALQVLATRARVLATDQRLLIIEADPAGNRIQSIWQLPYDQIVSADLPATTPFAKRMCPWLPVRLTIITSGNHKFSFEALHAELSKFVETLQRMRANPTSDRLQSPRVGPEQIFPQRETPSSAPDAKPTTKAPVYPALLSGLYPGLGQFYNGAFWRGVLFLIFFTGALTISFRIFMNWYWQHMEVPALFLVLLATGLVSIWTIAIIDAYADVTQEKHA